MFYISYFSFPASVTSFSFNAFFFLFTATKVHLTPRLIFSKYQPASPIPPRLELELDESWATASGTGRQLHINRIAPSICNNTNKIRELT
jgi:hypothetical protein